MEEPSSSVDVRKIDVVNNVDTNCVYNSDRESKVRFNFDTTGENINENKVYILKEKFVSGDIIEDIKVEKNKGKMSITSKQIRSTLKLVGQPNYLAIRSGAFVTVKAPINDEVLDLKCQVSNKYLCYVDMVVEKPAIC